MSWLRRIFRRNRDSSSDPYLHTQTPTDPSLFAAAGAVAASEERGQRGQADQEAEPESDSGIGNWMESESGGADSGDSGGGDSGDSGGGGGGGE